MGKTYSLYKNIIISTLLLLTASQLSGQFFYGYRQDFGKNRVQYTQFDWVFYRFERYDVYFYTRNDELAAQVARMADVQLARVENLLDAPLDERVQILVFNNLSDLKQSNVNSSGEEDYNTAGVTRISGRRLFLHFTGDYVKLEEDLRSGLAEVVLSNLVYGSFTESIRNSALLNLPPWYTEGLISFVGDPNDEEVDTWVRDAFYAKKFKKINALYGDEARFVGHSIWQYIADVYGRKVLKNVVYMAIVNRNIESGFLYILGKDLEAVVNGWKAYLQEKYQANTGLDDLPEKALIKAKKDYRITQMSTSKDGRYMAYVTQKFSRYKVYIYDTEKEKKKRIYTHGYRIAQNADFSFPLMDWHPNGKILAMITEEAGFIYLNFYNREDKKWERKKFFQFDKINSFQYSADGKRFVMSANKDGQSDIFIYTILNTKIEQLTQDTYTDFYPTWIMNDRRIAFSSNRPNDSLIKRNEATSFPKRQFDLYAMPAAEPDYDTVTIWQLTNTPGVNEHRVAQYDPGYLSFLTNRDGLITRNLIKIDSSIAFVDTTTHYEYSFKEYPLSRYKRSVIQHNHNQELDKDYILTYNSQRYRLYEVPHQSPLEFDFNSGISAVEGGNSSAVSPLPAISPTNKSSQVPLYYPGVKPEDFEINIEDYQFDGVEESPKPSRKETPKPKQVKILPMPGSLVAEPKEDTLVIPPKRNYFLSFYRDDFKIGFDNAFDNPQYQPFTGQITSDYLNQAFNMQLMVGVMDLMHDYKVTLGLNTAFQPLAGTSLIPNSEILVAVSDFKKRLDKIYMFTRRSKVRSGGGFETDLIRTISNEANIKYAWPFNPVASIRVNVGYRMDEIIQLARNVQTLETPTKYQDYVVGRMAYVYDNSRKIGLNLYSGLRYKVFGEYYRNLYKSETGLYTLGLDLRNYTVIHKNFIWANRMAYGTSFGPEKLIYIMGGTDNSFSNRVNTTTPMADENYIFQTLATNMRGFYQNIRNGNSFAVINSELRLPIFSYLMNKPIKSDFIKNFMVVGFGDLGTAWNGSSPWDPANAINTREVPFGPTGGSSTVVLDSQKNPIVGSYGVGARTRLFGYYLRFDWAWPVEDGLILDDQFTLSLGLDF